MKAAFFKRLSLFLHSMEEKNICNTGIVRKILDQALLIEIDRQSACSGCHAKSVCLSGQQKSEILKVNVENPNDFQVGETIDIYMEKSTGWRAIFVAYMLPTITLLASLFLTAHLTGNELIAFFVAIAATAFYFLLLWLLNKKKFVDNQFVLKIRKMNNENQFKK